MGIFSSDKKTSNTSNLTNNIHTTNNTTTNVHPGLSGSDTVALATVLRDGLVAQQKTAMDTIALTSVKQSEGYAQYLGGSMQGFTSAVTESSQQQTGFLEGLIKKAGIALAALLMILFGLNFLRGKKI